MENHDMNQKHMITKTVEPTGDLCIKFTDEEMSQLGIAEGDKFSFEEFDNGFLMKKYETIDIDLHELTRETLEFMIAESCKRDISINQVVENILHDVVKTFDDKQN